MSRYSEERKAAVLRKLLPPINMSVAEVSRQEGIATVTLYAWRNQVKAEGVPVPGANKVADEWSAEAKLAVVVETAGLSEIELSRYCREKGTMWSRHALGVRRPSMVSMTPLYRVRQNGSSHGKIRSGSSNLNGN